MSRWDPFGDLQNFERRVNRLFDSLAAPRLAGATADEPWAPPVDIFEAHDALVLLLDVPGTRRDSIVVTLERDCLTISGERPAACDDAGRRLLRCERAGGRFRRSFTIGVPVNPAQVRARYRDGVLEITLPRSNSPEPQRIEVPVEDE